MKKIIFIVLGILSTLSYSCAVGGGMTGGSNLPMQIVQNASAISGNGSTFLNTAANIKQQIWNTVLIPLIEKQKASILQGVISNTNNWVTSEALIPANPGKIIESAGLQGYKVAMSNLPVGDFSNSLFNSLRQSALSSNNTDIGAQLKPYLNEDFAYIVQKNSCDDKTLEKLALQMVDDPSTVTPAKLAIQKSELYNRICVGDPSANPELASVLKDLGKSRSELSGWDGFLCTTGGSCNETKKAALALQSVQEFANKQKELKSKEIFEGVGPVSQTSCNKYSEVTDPYEEPYCLDSTIITPGKTVEAIIAQSKYAPLARLATAPGDTLTSLLSTMLTDAVSGFANRAQTTGSPNISNTSVTISSSRPSILDLKDPVKKAESIRSIENLTKEYARSLEKLEEVDNNYLNALYPYEGRITSGRQCYSNLISSNLINSDDSRALSATRTFNKRQQQIDQTRSELQGELNRISQARTLIRETNAKLQAVQSVQEVTTIYDSYQNTIYDRGLPSSSDYATRGGDFSTAQAGAANDEELDSQIKACTDLQGNYNKTNSSFNSGGAF